MRTTRRSWPLSLLVVAAPAAALATLALVGIAAPACSSSEGASAPPATSDDAGTNADVLAPPALTRPDTEATLAPKRKACGFKAGAWPAESIGNDYPLGADIPIKHVIVIMQENRSFDHYLGRLVAQGYYKKGDFTEGGEGFAHNDELDGPPDGWSNPDSDGGLVVPHPDNEYCYGVNHSWGDMHDDYNDGKLDHFVTNNNPNGQRAMFYQDDTVIPFYYALASTFSVGDRYFASVMSSTWPNRLFAMAATSFGIGDNSFVTIDTLDKPVPQIFSLLEQGGHTWKDYTDGPHQVSFFAKFGWSPATIAHYGNIRCDLLADIKNDTLPDVSYVMGDEIDQTSDEGPSALPGIGGQLVEGIIRELFASKAWKDTAVFINYDENGGLADHVRPADACPPDDYEPHDENNAKLPGDFKQTGFRVPFIVVSPYSKAHYASHTVYDHASIVRFIEAKFGLPALSGRDANANIPLDMFDFKNPPFLTAPDIKAHTTVPQEVLTKCKQSYAPLTCDRPQ